MIFSLTTLYVQDMEKSLSFYNGLLGLPIVRKQLLPNGQTLLFMGMQGQPLLELIPSEQAVSYSGFSIGFNVEDLPSLRQRLAASGYAIKREFSPDDTTILCFLNGPNGEEIELISHA